MTWKPGQSGNPKGRPSKARSLSSILEAAGSASIEVDGKRIAGKRLVARLLWEIATTGRCTMPDGRTMTAGPGGWLDVVKFIYGQVDGPPPKDVNLGGQTDNPIGVEDVGVDAERRDRALSALAAVLAGAVPVGDSGGDGDMGASE